MLAACRLAQELHSVECDRFRAGREIAPDRGRRRQLAEREPEALDRDPTVVANLSQRREDAAPINVARSWRAAVVLRRVKVPQVLGGCAQRCELGFVLYVRVERVVQNANVRMTNLSTQAGRVGCGVQKESLEAVQRFNRDGDAGLGECRPQFLVKFHRPVPLFDGGYYERPYSTNPMNEPALTQASPKHPISRGWKSFQLKDEWYYRIRFREGDRRVTPILTAMLPKETPEKQVRAWAIEREDGGRGFGFTGLHPHQNWNVPELRTLLVNAVLWTAKWNIPGEGAKCDLAGGDLGKNLFPVANN